MNAFLQADARLVVQTIELSQDKKPFNQSVANALRNLWRDDAIQTVYARRNELQMFDSAG